MVMHPNRSAAKLRKLLGPNFAYRLNPKAPSAEERAEANAQLPAARAARDAALERRRQRYEALLAGDEEYQRLKAEAKQAQERLDEIAHRSRAYKITAGQSRNIAGFGCFHVSAEGDTWPEVIAKLERK